MLEYTYEQMVFRAEALNLAPGTGEGALYRMKRIRGLAAFLGISIACANASAQSWKFVVTGDSRGGGSGANEVNTAVLGEMAVAITNEQPDLVMFSGDLVEGYPATQPAFELWTNAMGPVYKAGIPVLVVRGNHDRGTGWVEVFGADIPDNGPPGEIDLTYWVTNKNAIFIAFDNYTAAHQVNQPWLDAVLASNNLPHVFSMGHEPAFSVWHPDCLDDYPAQRDAFWTSLAEAGAKVYFCGHDHFYDHMRLDDGDGNIENDLHQFLAGTAGAPLYVDDPYDGDNGVWTPVRYLHERQHGYLLVTIDEYLATVEWKHRASPGVYTTAETFSYSVIDQYRAGRPYPPDATTAAPADADLRWQSVASVLSHDVYWGTNEASVTGATTNSPLFMGNQPGTSYDLAFLDYLESYYWRIDEHLASGTVLTGHVWRFTTKARLDHGASAPVPADGASLVSPETDLNWTAGGDSAVHRVFLGTNAAQVAAATTNSPQYRGSQLAATYDPDALEYVSSYYWRVDEELADGAIVTGAVWSFSTRPVPRTLHVATGGLNNPPYTNWTDAALEIASALEAALEGDTILVGSGVYGLSSTLAVTNGVRLQSAGGRDSTIIDGGNAVRCVEISHEDAVVSGFTIRNGLALIGGGVFINLAGALENCLVTGNVTSGSNSDGGGVLCSWGGLVKDCEIVGNTAGDDGGGVACKDGGEVRNCIVRGNVCADTGGGVYLSGGAVWGSLIFDNEGPNGGGVYTKEGGAVRNCTITANRTSGEGGGIWFGDIGTVMNCIVYHNTGAQPATRNLGGNVQGMFYSCTIPDPSGVEVVTNDPQFVDFDGGNYRLSADSPCIDRGGDLVGTAPDLDGVPRPLDGDDNGEAAMDMGSYEFAHQGADTDGDGLFDAFEVLGGLNPREAAGNDGPGGDPDGDDLNNLGEQTADTHPNDKSSVLRLTGILSSLENVRVEWQGGVSARQYLEFRDDLISTAANWKVIFTNPPPTAVTTNFIGGGPTNSAGFYRLRAVRP